MKLARLIIQLLHHGISIAHNCCYGDWQLHGIDYGMTIDKLLKTDDFTAVYLP